MQRERRFPKQSEPTSQAVAQISTMLDDLRRIVDVLNQHVAIEEQTTKNNDPSHFAYSTVARALRTRRDNLLVTVSMLEAHLSVSTEAVRAGSNSMELGPR